MQGKGIVINTNGEKALVKIRKSSACGHDCGECRVCSNPEIEVEVVNTPGAKAGDTVLIGADTNDVLRDAFLLYILPIICVFTVYIISQMMSATRYTAFFLVLISLASWFMFMRHRSKNITIKSCILEVIHEEN